MVLGEFDKESGWSWGILKGEWLVLGEFDKESGWSWGTLIRRVVGLGGIWEEFDPKCGWASYREFGGARMGSVAIMTWSMAGLNLQEYAMECGLTAWSQVGVGWGVEWRLWLHPKEMGVKPA